MIDLTCPRLLADADGLICRDKRQPERIEASACASCIWRHKKPAAGLRASHDGTLQEVAAIERRPPSSRNSSQKATNKKPTPPKEATPICIHRGEDPLRIVSNKVCGCDKTPVYKCALFGECTPEQCREKDKGKHISCSTCEKFERRYRPADVTFGITAFERPKHLEKLVASILLFYPEARIIVADNGRQKAKPPACVEVIHLEFDCGLSAARNAIAKRLQTKYLCLLEEDFAFTAETKIEPLLDVLQSDGSVGCVGGSMRLAGRESEGIQNYALDLEEFRGTLFGHAASRPMKNGDAGTPYRYCDKHLNFGLWRREFLQRHDWDSLPKMGEHAAYFLLVKRSGQWRCAHTQSSIVLHDTNGRSKDYKKHRSRAYSLQKEWLADHGLPGGYSQPVELSEPAKS